MNVIYYRIIFVIIKMVSFPFESQVMSVILTTGSVITCLCSAGFAAVHLILLSNLSCVDVTAVRQPSSLATTSLPSPIVDSDSANSREARRFDEHGDYDYDEPLSIIPPTPPPNLPGTSGRDFSAILASLKDPHETDVTTHSCECTRSNSSKAFVKKLTYEGLACAQVVTVFYFLFVVVCIVCFAAAIASFMYICLLWASRYHYIPVGAYCAPSMTSVAGPSNIRSTVL